jgi:hypothetical protein
MKRLNRLASVGVTRRGLFVAAILAATIASPLALAQYDAAPAAVAVTAPVVDAPAPTAEPAPVPVVEPGSNADLANKLEVAVKEIDDLRNRDKEEGSPLKYLIAAIIAALANLLLSIVKRAAKLNGKAKKMLPWASMGLGLVIGIAGYYVVGTTMIDAILYGGAGPGAIIIQELFGPIKSAAKATAKEEPAKADA